jgi:Zn finger protein HypA/HybF involved in hydrogenase expression
MGMDKKQYYADYYQKNKEKHYNNLVNFRKQNPILEKKYREKYIESNKKKVVESWRISKLKQNENKRVFIDDYKKTCKCSKCSDTRWYVLDFHHLDPLQKKFNIGEATRFGLNKIKEELDKCIVLCRNCHSEFHYLEKENNINIQEFLK